jgi:uncharacterized protein YndB with AHSA1/START domain
MVRITPHRVSHPIGRFILLEERERSVMTEEAAKVSILVDASPKQVWHALVDPVAIKKYFMGTTVKTDWKVGSPISWSGEWKGKPFSDKGEILECEDARVLSYSHWSPLTGADNRPENYHVVTTTLHKTQSNLAGGVSAADRDSRADYEKNWTTVLEGLKATVEG